jgi:hypothetical protein
VSNDCESNATRYKGETMYSKAILIGRLGKKPEARITQTGKELVNMSLAVSERKDETTWFNLSALERRVNMRLLTWIKVILSVLRQTSVLTRRQTRKLVKRFHNTNSQCPQFGAYRKRMETLKSVNRHLK